MGGMPRVQRRAAEAGRTVGGVRGWEAGAVMPYGVPPRGAGKAPPLGSGLPPPWALWVDGTGQACQRASSTQMGKGVEVVGGGVQAPGVVPLASHCLCPTSVFSMWNGDSRQRCPPQVPHEAVERV